MNKLELLAKSKNGILVYYKPLNSHTAVHFAETPQLKSLVEEAINKSILEGEYLQFDTDLGRIIGNTDEVENSKGDKIVYAKRKLRNTYTPFNKTKSPKPCSIIAMGLARQSDNSYELLSAWIGSVNSPAYPGDDDETPESKPYWTSHSLVWGTQEIQSGTETSKCPW